MPHYLGRTASAALPLVLAALVLAGCAAEAQPAKTPAATASPKPSASSLPTASATPAEPTTPVSLSCDQLVTPDQMYAFNPNFGVAPDYSPAADSLQKKIADWQGIACAWQNQTSNDTIQIAVAHPPASQIDALKNQAITLAQPVPTYGAPPIEGYFTAGEVGQAQIFRGSYWIVAESNTFFEPGDVTALMENVLENIPAS